MLLSEFDYQLPPERIAQQPARQRDQSRLLVIRRDSGEILADRQFRDLAEYLIPGDLLVLNETQVNALRLVGTRAGGGSGELFLTHRIADGLWQALVKPGKKLLKGDFVTLGSGLAAEVVEALDDRGARLVRFHWQSNASTVDEEVERQGRTPLPPYIHSDASREQEVRDRYQTVYARHPGSSAAPTAGLHFTEDLLQSLAAKGIQTARLTLHVGVGTFRPIITESIDEHTMHAEQVSIPDETAQAIADARGRIIAVGTTSLRALESAAIGARRVRTGAFKTNLFVMPGYKFQIADSLITNFHMPRSTLLVLVSAFLGQEALRSAYAHALDNGYRFLSFGDAMLIASPHAATGA